MAESDVYTNTWNDNFPGSRERSRPGEGEKEQVYEKVVAPSGQVVSRKPANSAFLASKAKREAHARKAALAKQQRAQTPSGAWWPRFLLLLIFLPLLSSFTTNTYTFTLGPRYFPRWKKAILTSPLNPYRPVLRWFTPKQLAKYDGADNWLPVYVAINGEVYDVTKNRRIYGKGGSYNMMAGRDASRSFVTGCFQTHLTHDLRGLTSDQMQNLENWRSFFENHADYRLVGHVRNPPIDPSSPIPPPCNDDTDSESGLHKAKHATPKAGPVRAHGEL